MKSNNARLTKFKSLFAAEGSNTVSDVLVVKHYDYIVIQVATAALTDGELRVRSSTDKSVDLTAAKAVDNIWGYKYLWDLDSGSGIVGSAGVVPGGAISEEYKVNVDGTKLLALEISSWTAGAYTANVYGVSIYGS